MHRSYAVAGALVLMMGAFGFALTRRSQTAHLVAPPPPTPTVSVAAAPSASTDASADTHADAGADAAKVEKTLRVATLGFDVAAPAIVENGGLVPGDRCAFAKDDVEVHVVPTEESAHIESMLARGGDDPQGADVAVMPLTSFVSASERLRALDPRVFAVFGWSRGREALDAEKHGPITTGSEEVKILRTANENANTFALLVLDLAGTRARLTATSGKDVPFDAVDRAVSTAVKKYVLTSADTRLLPMVAVAPRGVIERRGAALRALSKGWFEGLERVKKDAPSAARLVSSSKGAPEAVVLLERFGQVEPSTLRDNARLLGLSGRGALDVAKLFAMVFRMNRATGVLTTPPPEEPPIDASVIAALVRADPALSAEPPSVANPEEPAVTPPPKGATLLLVRKVVEMAGKLDVDALTKDAALLAAVFDRATIRLSMRGGLKAAKPIILDARERFAVSPTKLVVGDANLGNAAAMLEVWIGQ